MDKSWAPQSPDLSSYHSADPAPPLQPQQPAQPAYNRGSGSHVPHYFTPPTSDPALQAQALPLPLPPTYMPRGVPREESMQDAEYLPNAPMPMLANNGNGVGGSAPTLPPNTDNITIKNHFPVARIKRIMQADDDVGKVAQVTPVVVSKALELFMISLVTRAAAEAKSRNSKRVGAVHLKQAIMKNEQFDFLNDIVSKVADAPEKSEADSMDADGKKKKTSSRKKKKAESDEDF
ncbi:hypothetical protein NX059_000145 [Plenodomus lindquistii]|nr:hypothetical protein NX059_000145 [Plenodomus lindquistii]